MQKLLLLGDEAIAQGALDAGISGVYAYPGTPSTEITEYIQRLKEAKERKIHTKWCANEKTAVETALGMSYAGKRAMACMKHVGLNVAADPFMNSAFTGANGGLLIVSADDPSMHSSQNEQDSRFYGKFALIPILEPSNQQEAYEMAYYGFDLSEKHHIPVLLRITTRLAHSRSAVIRLNSRKENELKLPQNLMQYVLLPSIARKRYKWLLGIQNELVKESENSVFNSYYDGEDKSLGIITSGIAFNYLIENYQENRCQHPILKIGQYPLPRNLVKKIANECEKLLVIEEGMPFIEEMLKGYLERGIKVAGKLDGTLQRDGELNPNLVAEALNISYTAGKSVPPVVISRPPSLCKGCPHIDTYRALNEAMREYGKGRVFSDIGCYTLGAYPPLEAINSCVDMGAAITMAKGAADAGLIPSVAVIGDSTFAHSGITGLLDAANENSPIVVIILDNLTTAMTGGQEHAGLNKLENICNGVGVNEEHIRIIKPLPKYHEENVKIIKEELTYNGTSVIIPRRECVQIASKKTKRNK